MASLAHSSEAGITPGRPRDRKDAANGALRFCHEANGLVREALGSIDLDDDHLFRLIGRREEVLQNLAECIAVLRNVPATADDPFTSAGARVADEADTLIQDVLSALDSTHGMTAVLVKRVADRVSELRGELDQLKRAVSVKSAYAAVRTASQFNGVG